MEKDFCFTVKDIKRIFLRRKKLYIRLFSAVFCSVFLFLLFTPSLYKANAVFKYASQEDGGSDLLRSFLQNTTFSMKENGVQSILESRTLLKQVVQDLGLVLEVRPPFFVRAVQTAKDRLYTEMGLTLPEREVFQFSHAVFEGEEFSDFFIRFVKGGSFDVLDSSKKKISTGSFGSPIQIGDSSFILEKASKYEEGTLYRVKVSSWIDTIKQVSSKLKLNVSKKDKNVLFITFSSMDSKVSSAVINHLMACYQGYLKKENEEMASMQMEYLEKRQKELMGKYERSLEEHVAFLQTSLKEDGFLSFTQEVDLLEKPNEEYLSKLYDVDLKLSRLDFKKETPSLSSIEKIILAKNQDKEKVERSFGSISSQKEEEGVRQELEGISSEMAVKLSLEYSQEWDSLRVYLEQLSQIQVQITRPDFEITSLSGLLTDGISQEMIRKAGQIALEMQDRSNYSSKDMERLQGAFAIQKQGLTQHIKHLIEISRLRSHLLEKKLDSLQTTSKELLKMEKGLIQKQLDSLQEKMKNLPERWKRENQLVMQRDLSMGVVEGLTQLSESKNIHHQLFQVESKPIDWAFTPYKASKIHFVEQSFVWSTLFCLVVFALHFIKWLAKGRMLTEDSAKDLGATFCGFLRDFQASAFQEIGSEDKETIRKISSFVASHAKEGKGACVSILSKSLPLVEHTAHLLTLRGLKVLFVECSPFFIHPKNSVGLYEYLAGKGPVTIVKKNGFSRIASGPYEGHFVELLSQKVFSSFIQENSLLYDVILLFMEAKTSDAAVFALQEVSNAWIIHGEDILYQEVFSMPSLAVVLSR